MSNVGGVPTGIGKGRVEEEAQPVLPLKNGGQIEVGLGLGAYRFLTALLENKPNLLHALLAIAQGRPEDVSAQQTKALRKAACLRRDLSIRDDLAAVLLSSYQDTPDGPVLTNPFTLETADQVRLLEEREKAQLDRLIRRLRRDDEGRAGGRE